MSIVGRRPMMLLRYPRRSRRVRLRKLLGELCTVKLRSWAVSRIQFILNMLLFQELADHSYVIINGFHKGHRQGSMLSVGAELFSPVIVQLFPCGDHPEACRTERVGQLQERTAPHQPKAYCLVD